MTPTPFILLSSDPFYPFIGPLLSDPFYPQDEFRRLTGGERK
jgi:hypothetical protein